MRKLSEAVEGLSWVDHYGPCVEKAVPHDEEALCSISWEHNAGRRLGCLFEGAIAWFMERSFGVFGLDEN